MATTAAETPANLQIITVDGGVYLGKHRRDGDTVVISDAVAFGSVGNLTRAHLVAYIENRVMDTLQKPITLSGAGSSVSHADLPTDLALDLETLELTLRRAEELAAKKLIVTEFKSLVGRGS